MMLSLVLPRNISPDFPAAVDVQGSQAADFPRACPRQPLELHHIANHEGQMGQRRIYGIIVHGFDRLGFTGV